MRLFFALALAAFPFAATAETHPEFTGTWQLDAASSQIHTRISRDLVWKIDQKDEGIHFVQSGAEKTDALEVTCGTRGADCKTREAGKPVTLSFWYNGAALVEMETEGGGQSVTKRKIQLSEDGASLIVEVTHIVPEGRSPEKFVLKKQH